MWLMTSANFRGPVSVTVPGVAIWARFSVTAVKSSVVVVPSSESWKVKAITAIAPDPSIVFGRRNVKIHDVRIEQEGNSYLQLRGPYVSPMENTPQQLCAHLAYGNGTASG